MAWNVDLLQSLVQQELVDMLVEHFAQRLVVSLVLFGVVADVELERSVGYHSGFGIDLAQFPGCRMIKLEGI